ncbi:hypothetical protein ES703_02981 [subsurface metagenome]
MSYKIIWDKKALDFFNKLQPVLCRRIFKKIGELRQDPFSKDIKRLKGEKAFRLRIGDYRVIFDINIKNRVIIILRLGHRKNIY